MKKLLITLALIVACGWTYKQLPMKGCAWCDGTFLLNRHHIIPQSVDPSLKHEPTNLIVLCRKCHHVLGHRKNWRVYNPDVAEICERFTNSIPCKLKVDE